METDGTWSLSHQKNRWNGAEDPVLHQQKKSQAGKMGQVEMQVGGKEKVMFEMVKGKMEEEMVKLEAVRIIDHCQNFVGRVE